MGANHNGTSQTGPGRVRRAHDLAGGRSAVLATDVNRRQLLIGASSLSRAPWKSLRHVLHGPRCGVGLSYCGTGTRDARTIRISSPLGKVGSLKVLISAYSCSPGQGSEPGAGWEWAVAAARAGHDVHLVTRQNNRPGIEDELRRNPSLPIRPEYFDLAEPWRRIKRGRRRVRLYYTMWQWSVRPLLRKIAEAEGIDVAHHVTFAVDWLPAAAVGLRGVPSVWGPVGGAGTVPPALYRYLGARGVTWELLREVAVTPLRSWCGRTTASKANLIVAQNDDVARFFRRRGRVVVEPNVALGKLDGYLDARRHATRPTDTTRSDTMVFVARLVPWKGLSLALAALAEMPPEWSLRVVGAGPDRRRAERLSRRFEVLERVTFLGELPRSEALREMRDADVMIFPSMHDSAGWAVAESIELGTPVVCLDLGGPATLIRRGGGGAVVSPTRDATSRLAEMAVQLDGAVTVSGVWSRDRLPDVVDGWYRAAVTD